MVEIKATYDNIPAGAMAGCTTTGTNAQPFVDFDDFKSQNLARKYATLEYKRWKLDGTFLNFPDNPQNIGYISNILSDENGDFADAIVITRTYDASYRSPRTSN